MVQTAREFIRDSYQLVSADNPTVPLKDGYLERGILILNELLEEYSADGLLLTVAREVTLPIISGVTEVSFGIASVPPDPLLDPTYTLGRLYNLGSAWLELEGVTYPLIDESRNVFFGSYKYDPQLGLPRFCIITYQNDRTTMRLYPGASQGYSLKIYGKFQLLNIGVNDDMSQLPAYYSRFLKLAVAYDLAFYTGRGSAWDEKLQKKFDKAEDKMISVSTINLVIQSQNDSLLNGAWRVKAGI